MTDEELARLKRQAAQQVASDNSGGRETHFSGADSIALIAEVERLRGELASGKAGTWAEGFRTACAARNRMPTPREIDAMNPYAENS